jgi:hypothetical protein
MRLERRQLEEEQQQQQQAPVDPSSAVIPPPGDGALNNQPDADPFQQLSGSPIDPSFGPPPPSDQNGMLGEGYPQDLAYQVGVTQAVSRSFLLMHV